ncbi:MAG: VTT domain-containing protein [Acidobacteriota bacterium]|nr:VTT domain-containing protein [Acidobacteriota bacterium]
MHISDLHFLVRHGMLWMFALTLAERLGLPLFVTPLLVASGALAAMGKMNPVLLLVATTVACLAGDTALYELGRWKGGNILSKLCRLSFQPDSCVKRSEIELGKHTGLSLLWAKWIPGVAHLALPMAGAAKLSRRRFHLYNGIGSVIWLVVLVASGYLSVYTIDWLGLFVVTARWAIGIALVACIVLIVHSYRKRQKFLQEMRMARITPEEVQGKITAGDAPVIVDLRHPLDFLASPRTLPGALRIASSQIEAHLTELPEGRDIVVYCTCPNEETAVKVTRQLQGLGLGRVRPLAGGLAGWEKLGYPVDHVHREDENLLVLGQKTA